MQNRDEMKNEVNFSDEIAKILPLIQREATRRMAPLFSETSLTIPQFFFLDFLSERKVCSMGDVAQVLNLSMGAATGIIDKMVELDLVKRGRSDDDRRVVNVTISDKGKEVIRKCSSARREIIEDIFSGILPEERREYLRILRKIYNNIIKSNEAR